jgi:hypothetical protein
MGRTIAELCCWDDGSTIGSERKFYIIQRLWSNSKGMCVDGITITNESPSNKETRCVKVQLHSDQI